LHFVIAATDDTAINRAAADKQRCIICHRWRLNGLNAGAKAASYKIGAGRVDGRRADVAMPAAG
jgi:hypothetical protein